MRTNLNVVEDVAIALKEIAKFRQDIFRELGSTEEKKVLEKLTELGQYAASIQNKGQEELRELIEVSEVLHHIIEQTPHLRDFLQNREARAIATKNVPLNLPIEALQESDIKGFVNEHKPVIIQGLIVITEEQANINPSRFMTERERHSWWRQIKKRVLGK